MNLLVVELQVDRYETKEATAAYFQTEAFKKNPIGIVFDPEALALAHRKLGYRAAYCPKIPLTDTDRIKATAEARRLAGTRLAATTEPMPKKAPWQRAVITRASISIW